MDTRVVKIEHKIEMSHDVLDHLSTSQAYTYS